MDIFEPVESRVVKAAGPFAFPARIAFNGVVGIAAVDLFNAGRSQVDNVTNLSFNYKEFANNFDNSFVDFDSAWNWTSLGEFTAVAVGTLLARHFVLGGKN